MLGVGGSTAFAIAKARSSVVSSWEQVRLSKAAIVRSQELLVGLRVYPFSTCVEPCCGFQVPPPDRSAALHVHTPAELRAQAAHARELADEIYNLEAQAELRRVADDLDAKAAELERNEPPNPMPSQSSDS
jgi:hypothetical protein